MDKKLTKLGIFLSMFLCLSFFINLIPPAQAVQELTINTTENGTDATFSTFQGADSLGENIWIGGIALSSLGDAEFNYFGSKNTSLGFKASQGISTGYNNSAFGNKSLGGLTTGYNNIAVGALAGLLDSRGEDNISSDNSVYLGYDARPDRLDGTNEIVIGASAIGAGSNSVVLGNSSTTKTILKGNVGIGTANTTGKSLSIGGSNANHLKIFSIDGSNAGIQLDNSMAGGSWDIQGGAGLFQIKNTTYGGAVPFNISGDKIGIGKTNPSYLLDVAGAGSFSQPVKVGTPIANTDAVTLSYLNSAISAGSVWTTDRDNIYNANLGNVGVGTNAPAAKLEVNGDDDTELRISSAGGSRPTLSLFENATSKLELMYDSGIAYIRTADNLGTGVPMYLGTKNITRLAIDGETGNVGIGTTNPGQQLEITKNFKLSATTGTTPYGIIYKGTVPFLHNFNYGNNGTVTTLGSNLFLGLNSGNFSMGSTATDMMQGSWNVGFGDYTLNEVTQGYGNTALGYNSLSHITTGSSNVAVGTAAGQLYQPSNNVSLSDESVFLGAYTKSYADNQNNEVVIGTYAIGNGSNSVTLGNTSITKTILRGNVGIGTSTPAQALDVLGRIAVNGKTMIYLPDQTNYLGTLYLGSAGGANLSRGSDSYPSNGQFNTYLGIGSGFYNTFGYENVGIGYNSLNKNTEGKSNIAIGAYAMENNLTGTSNIALGRNSLQANTSGKENTALGTNALLTNSTGENNTAVGFRALEKNTIGADNTAFGYLAMRYNNTGSDNVVIGQRALYYSSTTSNTVSIGRFAGYNQMGGSNIFIGSGAGFTDPVELEYITGSVVIGVNARAYADNQVVLGGDSILSTILKGKVGLGTTTPITAQLVIATSTTAYSFDSNGYLIKNVGTPILDTDAANKSYVDSALAVLSPNFIRRAVNDVNATATSTDNMISYTNVSVSRTVTIPATVCSAGKRLTIADESGSLSPTKTITIAPTGGTISGTSTQTIYEPYNNMSIYCSGAGNAWYIY